MQKAFKTSIAVAALAIACSVAFAQTPQTTTPPASQQNGQWHHHAPNPERETKMLTKRLQLTPEQAAAVEPILADRAQKMQALMPADGSQPDFKAVRAQRKAIMEDSKAKLDAVLTDPQKQQLAAMHERGGHRGNWNKGGAPSSTPTTPTA